MASLRFACRPLLSSSGVLCPPSAVRSCRRALFGQRVVRRVSTTAHVRAKRHPASKDPFSRHYDGPGSSKAWKAAQVKAAVKRKPAGGSKNFWMFMAFGASVAGSVGVMIYNMYTWTRARGSGTVEAQATPLIEGNPIIFFDLEADGVPIGRIVRCVGRCECICVAYLAARLCRPCNCGQTCVPSRPRTSVSW